MFKGMQNYFVKKMVQSQLKNLPKDQAEMVMHMVEKNPELFAKIAKETQELVKGGKDQTAAMMQVAQKYKGELQKMMQ
jgi:hypothetical protein